MWTWCIFHSITSLHLTYVQYHNNNNNNSQICKAPYAKLQRCYVHYVVAYKLAQVHVSRLKFDRQTVQYPHTGHRETPVTSHVCVRGTAQVSMSTTYCRCRCQCLISIILSHKHAKPILIHAYVRIVIMTLGSCWPYTKDKYKWQCPSQGLLQSKSYWVIRPQVCAMGDAVCR